MRIIELKEAGLGVKEDTTATRVPDKTGRQNRLFQRTENGLSIFVKYVVLLASDGIVPHHP